MINNSDDNFFIPLEMMMNASLYNFFLKQRFFILSCFNNNTKERGRDNKHRIYNKNIKLLQSFFFIIIYINKNDYLFK